MNVLAMGLTPWGDRTHLDLYRSKRGHEVRLLAISGDADYYFQPRETAADVVARVSRDWPVDILFCGCPEVLPPPCAIEHCAVKTVAAISDWNLYQPQLEYNLARFDLVLSDRLGERSLHVHGAQPRFVTPLYSHRTLIHRPLGLDRDIDILFLGNLNHAIHRERGRALEIAARLSSEYRIHIDGEYPPEAYARWMNRARTVVNYAVRHEMNLRCFEAPACGALLFVEDKSLEVPDALRDRDEVVFYNLDNLESLLREHLSDEAMSARVAANGCRRIQELAIENRMDALFDWIAGQSTGARAFHAFPESTRALADVFFYGASLEPGQRALATQALPGLMDRFSEPAFRLAAGCVAFEDAVLALDERRKSYLRECLSRFQEASDASPYDAVPWFNLAVVARQSGADAAEERLLHNVLDAKTADYGAFVLGKVSDPYYAEWRRALGLGTARIELLHAAAAARLAQCSLNQSQYRDAARFAAMAIELHPEISPPYRIAAAAALAEGRNDDAIALIETGRPFAPFDPDYGRDLFNVLRAAGRLEAARIFAAERARVFSVSPRFCEHAEWFRQHAAES